MSSERKGSPIDLKFADSVTECTADIGIIRIVPANREESLINGSCAKGTKDLAVHKRNRDVLVEGSVTGKEEQRQPDQDLDVLHQFRSVFQGSLNLIFFSKYALQESKDNACHSRRKQDACPVFSLNVQIDHKVA